MFKLRVVCAEVGDARDLLADLLASRFLASLAFKNLCHNRFWVCQSLRLIHFPARAVYGQWSCFYYY